MHALLMSLALAAHQLAASPASGAAAVLATAPLETAALPAAQEPAPLSASLNDLLVLPPAMRDAFRQSVLDGSDGPTATFERLADFVFAPTGMNVRYDEAATHTVAQTWATRRANCMGFTLLFMALAREAGLPAQAQEYRRTLTWQQTSGTVYRSSHVNLRVRAGRLRYTVDVARDAIITVDKPETIDDQRLLAHYHNNIAIQLMKQGQVTQALERIDQALRIDPGYPTHWSNAGVIHLRAGDPDGAERAYLQALKLDPDEYGTLFNLLQLLESQHEASRADDFRRRLAAVQDRDPLHHFLLGLSAERAGDYPQAIEHYREAIRHRDAEHRFHAALARAYLANGDPENASRSLSRARSNSSGAIEASYAAKLEWLQSHPGSG